MRLCVLQSLFTDSLVTANATTAIAVDTRYTQALKNLKKAREPGQESILIVTTDGLRVFEALTEDQMMVLDLLGVTFVSVLPVSFATHTPASTTTVIVTASNTTTALACCVRCVYTLFYFAHTPCGWMIMRPMQGDEGDEILGLIDTDERLDQKNCYLWSCRESGMAAAAEKVCGLRDEY